MGWLRLVRSTMTIKIYQEALAVWTWVSRVSHRCRGSSLEGNKWAKKLMRICWGCFEEDEVSRKERSGSGTRVLDGSIEIICGRGSMEVLYALAI